MSNGQDISILLKALLNPDKSDIEQQIRDLSSKIKERLELKLKINVEDLNIITKQAEEVQKKLKTKTVVKGSQFINLDVEHQTFNEISSRIREIRKNIDEFGKVQINTNAKGQINSATLTYYNKELGQTVKETMSWSEVQNKVNNELIKTFGTSGVVYIDDLSKANKEAQKLVNTMANLREKSEIKTKEINRKEEIEQSKAINKALEEEIKIRKETIGVFGKLQGDQVKAIDVAKILSKEYGNLEIRGQSLNKTTGAYNVTLKQNAKENLVLKGTLDKTTGALRVQNETIQAAKNIQLGFGEQLKVAIERSITWGIAMGGLYGSIRKFKEGVSYIIELDNSLNQVRIVTNKTQEEVNQLALSYNKLAKEMSVTTNEITNAAVEFYRQGLGDNAVEERLKATIQYAKISSMSFEEAAQILTATVNSMDIDINRVADVMSYLGDATATGKMCA